MECYKVVRVLRDGRLVSAVVDGEARVVYEPGRWARSKPFAWARGFGLFAFATPHAAEAWRRQLPPILEVWLAEGQGECVLPFYCSDADASRGLIRPCGMEFMKFPEGTVCFARLKLIRRLR